MYQPFVFLVQNTQNRDAKATHLKLDELIRSIKKARNQLIDIEDFSDVELKQLQDEFLDLSRKTSERIAKKEEKESAKEEFIPGS